jgi:hypothetical protein
MAVVMRGVRKTETDIDLVAYPILTEEVGYRSGSGATKATQVSAVQNIRCRFVDEKNKPFAGRRVAVQLPNGNEIEVVTDQDGWFEAEEGSIASASDDDSGYAIEAIVLRERL